MNLTLLLYTRPTRFRKKNVCELKSENSSNFRKRKYLMLLHQMFRKMIKNFKNGNFDIALSLRDLTNFWKIYELKIHE